MTNSTQRMRQDQTRAQFAALAVAGLISVGSSALTIIARLDDIDAFRAISSKATYGCLFLSLTCTVGVAIDRFLRSRGARTPWFFRIGLAIGVLAGGISAHTAWQVLKKADAAAEQTAHEPRHDLHGQTIQNTRYTTELRGALLQNATLRHVDLGGADLSETDLRGARLIDVNLAGADFCGADLRGADLSKAKGIDEVASWSYAFYDSQTRLPPDADFNVIVGVIPDTGRGLLYMCDVNDTRRLSAKHTL